MKLLKLFPICAMLLAAAAAVGQNSNVPATYADHSRITGVWRCQTDGLPAVTIVISDEGGSLSGAVLFYFHMRKTVSDPYTSTPGLPEPMFNLQVNGVTLTFQMSHRRAHPPRTLNDPPIEFHLTVTGPNQGELVNESENGPGCTMVRSVY